MRSPFARHVLSSEKVASIRACLDRGLSASAVAREIGCNKKTALDYRRQWIEQELQRAYDVLWDGDGEGCDAITAKLPDKEVRAMLDAWMDDYCDDKTPKSKWHG